MRSLAQELGVVPMALYKHVANKEQLLDGMVDVVVGEIGPPDGGDGWKDAVRGRILATRHALLRHPWAARVVESRPGPTPGTLGHLDSLIGMFRAGGLSADLTHHAMHALGGRVWGFTQELFPAPRPPPTRRSGPPSCARRPSTTRTSWRSPRPVPRTTTGRWSAAAATTGSSSSSPSTCCWTASSACTGRAGAPPGTADVPSGRAGRRAGPGDGSGRATGQAGVPTSRVHRRPPAGSGAVPTPASR
ncbi:TetR/AcrR family transcriptional regulator C-terminal domain-containing protein [Kitasatospora arboriphila]